MELQSGTKIWDLQVNPPSSEGVNIQLTFLPFGVLLFLLYFCCLVVKLQKCMNTTAYLENNKLCMGKKVKCRVQKPIA